VPVSGSDIGRKLHLPERTTPWIEQLDDVRRAMVVECRSALR
jgi:hypothetical protein